MEDAASHFFCHFVKFSCHFVKFSIFVIFLSKTFCFVGSYLYLCSVVSSATIMEVIYYEQIRDVDYLFRIREIYN